MLVRWGGVGLKTFLGGAHQHDATLEMGWGGVGLMEHVATFAHVVTIYLDVTLMTQVVICQKKRVKFNNRFVVAGTQQLDLKVLKKWKPIVFLPKKTNPMGGPPKIVANGREASSGGIMLGRTSRMLVAELKKMRPSRKDMEFLDEEQFPNFFPSVIKNSFFSPARITIFSILNWPTQYKMTLSKFLPNMKNVKTLGFNHFALWMMKKTYWQFQGAESADSLVFGDRLIPRPRRVVNFRYCILGCCARNGSVLVRRGGVGWGGAAAAKANAPKMSAAMALLRFA